jgi:hypothetical protein
MDHDDELVSRRDAPELIRTWFGKPLKAKTLANWECQGIGPTVYKLPHFRDAFYRKSELRAFFLNGLTPRR